MTQPIDLTFATTADAISAVRTMTAQGTSPAEALSAVTAVLASVRNTQALDGLAALLLDGMAERLVIAAEQRESRPVSCCDHPQAPRMHNAWCIR